MLALAGQGPADLSDADRMELLTAAETLIFALGNPIKKFAGMFMVFRPQAHQQVPL